VGDDQRVKLGEEVSGLGAADGGVEDGLAREGSGEAVPKGDDGGSGEEDGLGHGCIIANRWIIRVSGCVQSPKVGYA
jgi:hypothetical protein